MSSPIGIFRVLILHHQFQVEVAASCCPVGNGHAGTQITILILYTRSQFSYTGYHTYARSHKMQPIDYLIGVDGEYDGEYGRNNHRDQHITA